MNRPDITAKRVKMARLANDLSRDDLAALTSYSHSFIQALERQERRLTVNAAIVLAKALHVKPAWLLDLEE